MQTTKDDTLFKFEFRSNDFNRAIHGSDVTFVIKPTVPGQGKNKYIQIAEVKYPKKRERTGFIKVKGNLIYFVSLDKKFGEMLVSDIRPELYQAIRPEGEIMNFSYIKRSKVDSRFVERHFFKADFTTWSAFEPNPYCTLKEDLGPIYDIANYKKIILLNQNISQEMYPHAALQQAENITEQFDGMLEMDMGERKDLLDQLVFTIDSPGAQALDDAISL